MSYAAQAASLSVDEVANLLEELDKVKQQLTWFQNQIFGKKSEKRVPVASGQLWLGESFKEATEVQEEAPKEKVTYERKKRKRGVLPGAVDSEGLQFDESVPVKVIKVPNPEIEGLTEGKDYEVFSTRTHSKLAQKPASYVVLRYEEQVVKIKESGKMVSDIIKPEGIFPGSYADVSFVANLIIDKIQYHLPLYRQHQRIAAAGVKIARSSLTNFFHGGIDLLRPIYKAQLKSIVESLVLAMDEIPVKVGLSKHKPQMNQGYFWAMYGDKDELGFHYSPSRASPVVEELLGTDFKGTMLSDAHSAYSKFCEKIGSIVHAVCWSHTRRNFIKAEGSQTELASIALDYIGKAYHEESEIRGSDDATIQKARGEKVKLIIDEFFEWLKTTFKSRCLLPTDAFTKAANYALEREQKLRVFLDNPAVPMDTNHLERQIRPVAVGRKNWLFCWTEVGATYAAIAYSLIATCKLHNVNPYHYLVDVLQRVSITSQHEVHLLTPRLWKDNFSHTRLTSPLDWPDSN